MDVTFDSRYFVRPGGQLKLHDGREVWAQVTREEARQLELAESQIVALRLPEPRVFAG